MRRLVREPLVHFLLLGAALFGLYSAFNKSDDAAADEIVVSAGQVENLAASYANVWQKTPSQEELQSLIDDYVKEEVLSREAIKLGLDRHDPVIRRRLQQKMEFFAEDFAAIDEPTDEDLAEYLAKHPEKFQEDARFTFRQIYLNPDQRGEKIESDAVSLLSQLRDGRAAAETAALGDQLLLPQEFNQEPWAAVSAQFGREFADSLETVPTNEWAGPIRSGYGQHLVFVSERTKARMPPLAEVRRQVERNFNTARREEVEQKFYDQLLKSYSVTVEWPKESAPQAGEQTTTMHP